MGIVLNLLKTMNNIVQALDAGTKALNEHTNAVLAKQIAENNAYQRELESTLSKEELKEIYKFLNTDDGDYRRGRR